LKLCRTVQEYLKSAQPELADLPLVIKAVASADGLSRALTKFGVISSPEMILKFAMGFSQATKLCDLVLVGRGKDRTDEKIKGNAWKKSLRGSTREG
jgi:hypothetical protein